MLFFDEIDPFKLTAEESRGGTYVGEERSEVRSTDRTSKYGNVSIIAKVTLSAVFITMC